MDFGAPIKVIACWLW